MPKVRNSSGRFAKQEEDEEKIQHFNILFADWHLFLPRFTIMNLLKFLLLLFIISPWLYIIYKKGSLSHLNENIATFYENTFTVNKESNSTTVNGKSL